MIGLEPEMTYRVRAADPLEPTEGSPLGVRQYWHLVEGTLEGARIRAKLASTGGDWMGMGGDGFWRPDVRNQFLTEDGAVIFMHYTGLVEQTLAFRQAAENDRETSFEDQYLRISIRFDTGAPRYQWLSTSLFLGAGRLLGTGQLEYAIYRVT